MKKAGIRDWLYAVSPALAWLLFRRIVKSLPPAAEICLTCLILAAVFLLYCRKNGTAAFRLSGRECLVWIAAGFAFGLLNRTCFGKPSEVPSGIAGFVLLCVLGPAAEELVYRGLVYGHCLRFLPETGAVLLNSLLFSAAHGSPGLRAVSFAAGMLFSCARKQTGSLTVPVIIHMISNMIVFLF